MAMYGPEIYDRVPEQSEQRAPAPATQSQRAGSGDYVVRQGDCMESIASDHGSDPNDVWDLNQSLKEQRSDGILYPGDRVTLPASGDRPSFRISKGAKKKFKAHIPKAEIRLKLTMDGEPRANVAYTAVVDGIEQEGTTEGDGTVKLKVRAGSRRAMLILHTEEDGVRHDQRMALDLGALDPPSSPSGAQARLRALGYQTGPIDGRPGGRTESAVRDFQRDQGLEESGVLDQATLDKLSELHGP